MKLGRVVVVLALVVAPAVAGAQAMQHAEESGWKELDAFHKVLAANWHPASTGDTKPARAQAPALLDAALAWRKSRGPAKCDNAQIREGIGRLVTELRWHADAVKRESSDDAVTVTLRTAHATFEEFAEPCMMGAMKPDATKRPQGPPKVL